MRFGVPFSFIPFFSFLLGESLFLMGWLSMAKYSRSFVFASAETGVYWIASWFSFFSWMSRLFLGSAEMSWTSSP